MDRNKVALIVGHSAKAPGAANRSFGFEEFTLMSEVVDKIISKYSGDLVLMKVLRGAYSDLPAKVDSLQPVLAIEFHANAFNAKASGTETLYAALSKRSKSCAEIIQSHMVSALGLADRGAKGVSNDDRGGYLLVHTKTSPIVIIEPFFIDNDSDTERFVSREDRFIEEMCKAIDMAARG